MRSSTGAAQPGFLSSTRSAAYVASARIPGSWANRHPYDYILQAFLGIVLLLPVGLVRGPHGVVTKHPDREVQERISLIFTAFLELGSIRKTLRRFPGNGLALAPLSEDR